MHHLPLGLTPRCQVALRPPAAPVAVDVSAAAHAPHTPPPTISIPISTLTSFYPGAVSPMADARGSRHVLSSSLATSLTVGSPVLRSRCAACTRLSDRSLMSGRSASPLRPDARRSRLTVCFGMDIGEHESPWTPGTTCMHDRFRPPPLRAQGGGAREQLT